MNVLQLRDVYQSLLDRGDPMAKHKVKFTKSEKEIEVDENQSLLDAGLEAGINLQYGCMAGSCTACMVNVKGDLNQDDALAMSPEAREEGVERLGRGTMRSVVKPPKARPVTR